MALGGPALVISSPNPVTLRNVTVIPFTGNRNQTAIDKSSAGLLTLEDVNISGFQQGNAVHVGGANARLNVVRGTFVNNTNAILADNGARARTFGLASALATRGFAAVKTGTSKDLRDNWCVGFTDRYTVGVWVGNASGEPMHEVSGVSGAAKMSQGSASSQPAPRGRRNSPAPK